MESEYARAGEGIGETRMQSLSVSRDRLEKIETDLKDTQSKISETLPKLISTRENSSNIPLVSSTGHRTRLSGLTVFTIGGVVCQARTDGTSRSPDRQALVIEAQLKNVDADEVYPGQKAQGPLPEHSQSIAAAVYRVDTRRVRRAVLRMTTPTRPLSAWRSSFPRSR